MPVFRDRVKDTTTSTGTGAVTLSGTAPSGYQAFSTAYPALGTPFLYCIAGGAQWETGAGYLSTATTMVRSEVMDGSSGINVPVSFSAGSKEVFVTITAHWVEDADSGATLHKIRGMAMP